ncbi:MAG: DUF4013 domain-containing protein [Deltaproteobacteria bacterium]|nr:DUF4013 domain-containing protein [Deltaproteobacteria bacterium]
MSIDLSFAFKAPIQDQSWKTKVLIGGLINIIPIVNFISMGYSLAYLRELFLSDTKELPVWKNWGELFLIGLKAFVISLVYLLGVIVLAILSPILLGLVGGILAVLLFLAVLFLLPVALVRFVQDDYRMGVAFDIGQVYEMAKARFNDYFIAYIVIIGAAVLIALVSSIPLLGWIIAIFASFYLALVSANLLLMVFGGESFEVAPEEPGDSSG